MSTAFWTNAAGGEIPAYPCDCGRWTVRRPISGARAPCCPGCGEPEIHKHLTSCNLVQVSIQGVKAKPMAGVLVVVDGPRRLPTQRFVPEVRGKRRSRVEEVGDYARLHGTRAAAEHFGLEQGTVHNYRTRSNPHPRPYHRHQPEH